ncbi:hypothetical protein KP509_27G013500 [Ceratopteris richardii]|uniref:Mitochondrial ATPase inhibitor n=1 Tax=Ceratopteris richardii TaxID=49495 RepID=A0A8T2RDZ2_CERRI|nr:hypothetical protein KP509_27G013500 [Ceratopteris richardii]
MASLSVAVTRGCKLLSLLKADAVAKQLGWCYRIKRSMSAFDDKGSILRDEERSREAVYMKQREAELLEKLRKQGEKLEEIKRALAEYKEGHHHLTKWLHESKVGKEEHKS